MPVLTRKPTAVFYSEDASAEYDQRFWKARAILHSRSFALQLLGTQQRSLAGDFASRTGSRFAVHDHHVALGVPLLCGTLGWAACALIDARR